MKELTIDFDIFKHILQCKSVRDLKWRVSSSGKGFHFSWKCSKVRCSLCSAIEIKFDDPNRYHRDGLRKKYRARVLWDSKGGKNSGKWNRVKG